MYLGVILDSRFFFKPLLERISKLQEPFGHAGERLAKTGDDLLNIHIMYDNGYSRHRVRSTCMVHRSYRADVHQRPRKFWRAC